MDGHTAPGCGSVTAIGSLEMSLKKKKDGFSSSLFDLDMAMDDLEFLSLLSPPLKYWFVRGHQHAQFIWSWGSNHARNLVNSGEY